jgi:hypothetical protein
MPTKQEARSEYAKRPGYLLSLALLQADKPGRWLAEKVNTTDAQVSRWRKGMRPGKQMQHKIAVALSDELGRKITPEELGW